MLKKSKNRKSGLNPYPYRSIQIGSKPSSVNNKMETTIDLKSQVFRNSKVQIKKIFRKVTDI